MDSRAELGRVSMVHTKVLVWEVVPSGGIKDNSTGSNVYLTWLYVAQVVSSKRGQYTQLRDTSFSTKRPVDPVDGLEQCVKIERL